MSSIISERRHISLKHHVNLCFSNWSLKDVWISTPKISSQCSLNYPDLSHPSNSKIMSVNYGVKISCAVLEPVQNNAGIKFAISIADL